jgi:GTP cyclohydrolase II
MRLSRKDAASTLFGSSAMVGVTRGLAEFRAGRPVEIVAEPGSIVALPVEGLTPERLTAFQQFCAPSLPRLAVTARRARALGIVASVPLALQLTPDIGAETIVQIVANAGGGSPLAAEPARPAAAAAVDLAKLAQVLPAVLVAEAMPSLLHPPIVQLAASAVGRFHEERAHSLSIASEAEVPLASGIRTRFVVFRDLVGDSSVAVVIGALDLSRPTHVRLHSACLTGDAFGSRRCDCGDQLSTAVTRLSAMGGGIILYLPQEGRGVGLSNKMRAYQLQDAGLDTVDANTTLGFDDDERQYGVAARMLEQLGCTRVVLLTNNPAKLDGLAHAGIEIAGCVPLETPINADNRRYLAAKAARSGHRLDQLI